jgi:hypothetical protein
LNRQGVTRGKAVIEAWRIAKYAALLLAYAAAGYLAAVLVGSWPAFGLIMIWFVLVLIRRRRRQQSTADRAPRDNGAAGTV